MLKKPSRLRLWVGGRSEVRPTYFSRLDSKHLLWKIHTANMQPFRSRYGLLFCRNFKIYCTQNKYKKTAVSFYVYNRLFAGNRHKFSKGQVDSPFEQSFPVHCPLHLHCCVSKSNSPWPEQSGRHCRASWSVWEQSGPVHPWRQTQEPSTQKPCPPQVGSAQSAGEK